MRVILKVTTVVSIVLMTACATIPKKDPQTQQNYADTIKSWQGADLDSLFKVWAYPDHIAKLPNGHKMFTYKVASWEPYRPFANTTSITNIPQNAVRAPQTVVENAPDEGCTTWFEIDPKKQEVVSANFSGACSVSQSFVLARSFSTANKDETL
jgi:hypothetical protein